jgi:hypothetical protein
METVVKKRKETNVLTKRERRNVNNSEEEFTPDKIRFSDNFLFYSLQLLFGLPVFKNSTILEFLS